MHAASTWYAMHAALQHYSRGFDSRIALLLPLRMVTSMYCGPTMRLAVALTSVMLPSPHTWQGRCKNVWWSGACVRASVTQACRPTEQAGPAPNCICAASGVLLLAAHHRASGSTFQMGPGCCALQLLAASNAVRVYLAECKDALLGVGCAVVSVRRVVVEDGGVDEGSLQCAEQHMHL